MNMLTTFAYLDNSVRVVEVDGQPWFVALDLCKTLNVYLGTRSKAPNVTLLARDLLPDETALNQIKGCLVGEEKLKTGEMSIEEMQDQSHSPLECWR